METPEERSKSAMKSTVPKYALLFFDHLASEYVALKPSLTDYEALNLLEQIHRKRQKDELTWSDIYTFDLALVDVLPPETLVHKALDARAKYRTIAGQKEYDEYIASKPVDLGAIQIDPKADPPRLGAVIERELRADIKYLLSKFYLYYALLPFREGLRDQLTKRAVILTGLVVLLIAVAIGVNVGGLWRYPAMEQYSAVVVTVLTVMLAGIVGGCVSMLQRIQSAPSEGDALFNLATLTNGWRAILLSPLYGGIFAFLLFILFAGGIINGSVFPSIATSAKVTAAQLAATPAGTEARPVTAAPSPTPAAATSAKQSTNTSSVAQSSPTATPAIQSDAQRTDKPVPSPTVVAAGRSAVLQIKDFLRETGPTSGIAYALLIIWSFLAGFAERLVPDTLNRLVQKNIDIGG
jgi:hypothetical protein